MSRSIENEPRFEARLRADLARYRHAPEPQRRARILARIERTRDLPAPARSRAWVMALAAAGLLLVVWIGSTGDPARDPASATPVARSEPPPALQAPPEVPAELDRGLADSASAGERGGLLMQPAELVAAVRAHQSELGSYLEEPLLNEARLLADDGARVAAVLLQRLPAPLRMAFSGSGG